jgi:hypothetical protein
VSDPADFANPEFEPTDEQLQALSREAFAEVSARNRAASVRLRARVAALRSEVLARLSSPDFLASDVR